ncbi:hypothetical protein, partial [Brachyspira catarrhinii]|uniref:hypothetical protein n=1 Tax=Brachyspira catarrhinii TaxID=2528966 RepID=UPI001386D0B2
CQCKNNVSDPNNIPPDNGMPDGGSGDGQTDTGDSGSTDPDKDLVDGALSTTSTKLIIVAGAGDTVKTTSTIKFKNATGTLTAIADVDASANTTLAVDDFDYTGTTLTFKKDTADASKYDATTLAKVSWSGIETKKVKATFSLTPTSENLSLTTTTQEVEIEIGKVLILSTKEIFNSSNLGAQMQYDENYHTFNFKLGSMSADGLTYSIPDSNPNGESSGGDISISGFKNAISTKFAGNSEYFKNYFDGINWVSHQTETYTPRVVVKLKK